MASAEGCVPEEERVKTIPYSKLKFKRKPRLPKRSLRPIRFRGFDWTELGQIWGLEITGDDAIWAQVVRQRLWEACLVAEGHQMGGVDHRPDYVLAKWQIKQVRRYVMKISDDSHGYDGKVWSAIAMIKCDSTFVKWISQFLEFAWT